MPAFKKACPRCACEIHVRKSKCPCGYSFSVKPKLILKPQNAMKSLDSRKKTMVMCQARKRDLESVEQSQKRKLADSECHAHKKAHETPEVSQSRKQANAECHARKRASETPEESLCR